MSDTTIAVIYHAVSRTVLYFEMSFCHPVDIINILYRDNTIVSFYFCMKLVIEEN